MKAYFPFAIVVLVCFGGVSALAENFEATKQIVGYANGRLETPVNQLVTLSFEAIDLTLQLGRGLSAARLGCVPAFLCAIDGVGDWIVVLLRFVGGFGDFT